MNRSLIVATVQMDAAIAPLDQRLARAERLIAECARHGAHLVVLPELFNTGYTYADSNYAAAEPLTGETLVWMKQQAQQHNLHLVGTLLLLDGDHIFNAAFLIAPDGELWRYNKQYPFAAERAFFREGDTITVAHTALGKIGMMICWDAAHASVWKRYAGRVDLMVIPSCAPMMNQVKLALPDRDLTFHIDPNHFADADVNLQARWLGVPAVMSGGSGSFDSPFPLSEPMFTAVAAFQPALHASRENGSVPRMQAAYPLQASKIISATGDTLAFVAPGDGYALAEVTLADETPQPDTAQPAMQTRMGSYVLADYVTTGVMAAVYQRALRAQYGAAMAPTSRKPLLLGGVAVMAFLAGVYVGRKN